MDAKITSPSARGALAQRGNPYFRRLHKQLHLGYRKNESGGRWVARRKLDGRYESEVIGEADDAGLRADGVHVLTYDQADAKARKWAAMSETVKDAADYTVEDALADYFKEQELRKGKLAIKGTQSRANLRVVPVVGSVKLQRLTKQMLQQWLRDLGNLPRMWHGRVLGPAVTDEEQRKRKATANTIWTIFKAALNHAFREGKVDSDAAWRRVQSFRLVDVPKNRPLDGAEITRFLNAAEPSFRRLASGALLTGARYGELTALTAQDFDRNAGVLHIRMSKSGKARHVFLTEAGVSFFAHLTVGRGDAELMFTHANGDPWIRGAQTYPQRQACLHARLKPFSFHILRHNYGAQAVMSGMPLQVLAQNLGHSTTRMTERHYAHLTSSYVRDAVRQFAPSFGIRPEHTVVPFEPKPALAGGAP